MKKINALDNWRQVNKSLRKMSEKDIESLLLEERNGRRRKTLMRRIHQRLSKLRSTRERKELKC